MITAGIDAGAATTKVVLLDQEEVAGYRIRRTAFNFLAAAKEMYGELLVALDIEPARTRRLLSSRKAGSVTS
jgi:activator of 2-hydroxyglutaryl-CoA dehydratase